VAAVCPRGVGDGGRVAVGVVGEVDRVAARVGGRLALLALGIRHHRTAPRCPWQTGRAERFFATFKNRIIPRLAETEIPGGLEPDLQLFRPWYKPRPASPAPRRAHPRSGLGRQDAGRTAALPLRVEWTPHRLPLALVTALATTTLETDIECPRDAVPVRHDRPSYAIETEVNRTAITGSEASSRP
jgi:transposase InsO family protein